MVDITYAQVVDQYNNDQITLNEARRLLNRLGDYNYPDLADGWKLKSELKGN